MNGGASETLPRPWRRAIVRRGTVAVLFGLGFAASVGVAVIDVRDVWLVPGSWHRAVVKQTIYWAMALLVPLAALLAWRLAAQVREGRWRKVLSSSAPLVLCLGLIWARFVEPAQLRVIETPVQRACGVRVALVSDLHMGFYRRPPDLAKLVDRLNALEVNAVLVAGDLTYGPSRDLVGTFAPWSRLAVPSYVVLGNHDEQQPGPPLQNALRRALEASGATFVDGERLPLGRCELIGLGDLQSGSAERDLAWLATQPSAVPAERRVVLTHEPDTAALLPRGMAALMLAGHTHGGQIALPGLRQLAQEHSSSSGLYDRGLYDTPTTRLFITSGTGMSKVPLRLGVPPTIDVLTL